MAKDWMNAGILVAVVILGAMFMTGGFTGSVTQPQAGPQQVTGCGADVTPSTTVNTVDKYNTGTAVVTQNMVRLSGTSTRSDVAGAAAFTSNPFDNYEIVIGIDSDDEAAEPYGPIQAYSTPCKETPQVEYIVAHDSLATDLTGTYYDEFERPNTAQTWTAGNVKTLGISFTGAFEEDYGNKYCEVDKGKGNLLIAKFNSTQVDKISPSSVVRTSAATGSGDSYLSSIRTASIPPGISSSLSTSGYSLQAWEFPVIESNSIYKMRYSLDGDDTVAVNTTTSAITWYLYDVGLYIDSDEANAEQNIKCGWEDEDQTNIAAASSDSITPSVGA